MKLYFFCMQLYFNSNFILLSSFAMRLINSWWGNHNRTFRTRSLFSSYFPECSTVYEIFYKAARQKKMEVSWGHLPCPAQNICGTWHIPKQNSHDMAERKNGDIKFFFNHEMIILLSKASINKFYLPSQM